MKLPNNSENKSLKDYLDESIDESINESYANYGGTNAIGSVQGASKNKYTPATVLKAPPLRLRNPDITMGQSDIELKAPEQMLYPFESLFGELVDIFLKMESVSCTMEMAKDMPTLTPAKQKIVNDALEELYRLRKDFGGVITKIEGLSI